MRIFCSSQSRSATFVAVTEPNSEPVGPALTSKRSSVGLEPLGDRLRLVDGLRLVARPQRVALLELALTSPGVASSASPRGSR